MHGEQWLPPRRINALSSGCEVQEKLAINLNKICWLTIEFDGKKCLEPGSTPCRKHILQHYNFFIPLYFHQLSLMRFNIRKKKRNMLSFLAFNIFWFHIIFFLFLWGIFSARQTAIMDNLGKAAYEIPSENREMTEPHFLRQSSDADTPAQCASLLQAICTILSYTFFPCLGRVKQCGFPSLQLEIQTLSIFLKGQQPTQNLPASDCKH